MTAVVTRGRTAVLVLALAMVTIATGCGSATDDTSATTTTSTPLTPPTDATDSTTTTARKTGVSRSVPPATKNFCDYISSVTLSDIKDADWVAGYNRIHAALGQAAELAPAAIKQAVTDLRNAVDSLEPEVTSEKVTSNAQLDVWFAKQDAATKTRVQTASKQIALFYEGNCR